MNRRLESELAQLAESRGVSLDDAVRAARADNLAAIIRLPVVAGWTETRSHPQPYRSPGTTDHGPDSAQLRLSGRDALRRIERRYAA